MTIGVVQFNGGSSLTSGATTISVTATFTADNYAHLVVHCLQGFDVSSITSVPSQVWTALENISDAGMGVRITHFVSDALVGGSTTITANYSGGSATFRAIAVKEIGGSAQGYDDVAGAHAGQFQNAPGLGSDLVTTGNTPTLSTQPALISGWSIGQAGTSDVAPSEGTGFTNNGVSWNFGSPSIYLIGESKRVTATTGLAATFTAVVNSKFISVAAVFLEPPPPANAPLGYFDPELNIRAWF